jgi:methionyl-tRNA formyltransferase
MRVVKALDAGAMLARVRRRIDPDETSDVVEADLAILGAHLLVETLDLLAHGGVQERPQDHSAATYAPRLTKEDGIVLWSRPARELHDQIRGLHPWPHAYSYVNADRLILLRSRWSNEHVAAAPGTVVRAEGDELKVATGQGTLLITELQAEGRRAAATRAFLAGHHLAGQRFQAQRPGGAL